MVSSTIRSMAWVTRLVIGLGVGLTCGATALYAERPSAPKLLPENTLAYFRVADAQETVTKLGETSMGRMLNDDQVRPLVNELYRSAADAFSNVQDVVGLSLDELLAIPQGELCAALIGSAEGPPAFVFLADVGNSMKQADTLINRLLQEAGNNGTTISTESHVGTELTVLAGRRNNRFVLFTRENTVVISSDVGLCKQLLDVWDGSSEFRTLADNRTFTAIMSQSVGTKEERPQISWFVDPIGIVRNVGRGNLGAQAGLALLSPLGLDDFEGLGGSMILATEEFDAIGHFHVLLKNPRRAVLKMLAMTSGDPTPETWVPKDAASYMTLFWDTNVTFSELATLYDLIRLEEGGFARVVRTRMSEPLGVDIQNEVLPLLDGRFSLVTAVERPIKVNSQVTGIGVRVKDTEAARKTLEKLVAKFPETFERKTYGASVYYSIKIDQPQQPTEFEQTMVRVPQPSLMLLGDYLLFADSSKLLERFIVTKSTPGSSLADDLEYKLVASRIQRHTGGRIPGLMSFARPEESLRAIYELATAEATKTRLTQAAENNPFFQRLDGALTKHPLPPFSVLSQYLAPSGSMMVSDETGFHWISFGLKRE